MGRGGQPSRLGKELWLESWGVVGRPLGAGWVGRSPGPGVRLSFLRSTKLELVKGFRQDAFRKLLLAEGLKVLEEMDWWQEGQLDVTAASLVSDDISDLGKGRRRKWGAGRQL